MVNRGEEKVRVHMNVVSRSTGTQIVEQRIKVAQKSFQHFPRRSVRWVIITTLYQLMLQSWYQKTAQSLVNPLILFS